MIHFALIEKVQIGAFSSIIYVTLAGRVGTGNIAGAVDFCDCLVRALF
jgi:Na+/alanine symporter